MSFVLAASRRSGIGAFRKSAIAPQIQNKLHPSRQMSTLHNAYRYIFQRNVTYVTYIVGGCIVMELVFGNLIDSIWDRYNKGKQFKDVDWSKFKSADDESGEEAESKEEEEE